MYEVEVKARLKNKEAIIKKLDGFGCKFSEEIHQVDRIFIPKDLAFPPPIGTAVLRVREQDDIFILTLKISQSGRQDSIERELEIEEGKMMVEIINLIGYKEASLVDKKRIKTKYKDMVIEIDTVKDLGEFIEVEKIITEENSEVRIGIQKEIADFIETLGVAKEDLLVNGKYDIMLWEKQQGK